MRQTMGNMDNNELTQAINLNPDLNKKNVEIVKMVYIL